MRVIAVLFVMLVLTPVVCSAQQDSRLEGCVDPQVIATVLGELRQENARPLSVEQFRAMWPTALVGAEVEPTATNYTLRSNDRIANNHCQCCAIFSFNVRPGGGAAPLELRSVIVNYTARRRETLVEMAKLFAQTVGLGEADLKTVGAEELQDYQWEKIKGEERRLYVIDLRFDREEEFWKMNLQTSSYVVEP